MKLHRIYAVLLRHVFLFRHSFDRLSDAFYWPLVDLLLWGLTSTYFRLFAPNASQILLVIMSGILFWIIVWRGQHEISVGLLEDLWNKNLINMFVSPLKFYELISAFIILGIGKGIVSFAFAGFIAYLLYKVHLFIYGFYMIPFMLLLIMSGWSVGFLVSGILLRYGSKFQTFAWTLVMVFSPFSAIYYPVSILPNWAQTVSSFIPTSYIFEGAREIIYKGNLDINKLIISFVLNLIYLIVSLIFFKRGFQKALDKGLAKLY